MNTRTQHAALTASIMRQNGFEAEAIGNRIVVSLKNRHIGSMEVMTVIDSEELPISRGNVLQNSNGVVITI